MIDEKKVIKNLSNFSHISNNLHLPIDLIEKEKFENEIIDFHKQADLHTANKIYEANKNYLLQINDNLR